MKCCSLLCIEYFTNRNEVTMVILLCYTSAFSEVIYADFYAKVLDWNFRLVDENSRNLVVVFVSKLNLSFSFRFVDENCRIFVVVIVFVIFVTKTMTTTKIRKLIYFRQRKFSFSSSSTKKTLFTALIPGPPGWAGARRELLDFTVQGKINRGRHTDHPAGRHSICTNQCQPPPSPQFLQARCPSCRPTNSVKALKATSAFGLGRRR